MTTTAVVRFASLLLCGAVAIAPQAGAQRRVTALGQDCAYQRLVVAADDLVETQWAAFHPSVQLAAVQPSLERHEWLDALDAVSRMLDSAVKLDSSGMARSMAVPLHRRIASARTRVAGLLDAADATGYATHAESLLRLVGPGTFVAEPREARDGGTEYVLFRSSSDSIVLRDATPASARRAICYHAAVTRALLDRFTGPAREDAAAFVAAKRVAWERYYQRGYSQLPWELFVNSLRIRRSPSLDPPTTQVVFLHPSVGAELPLAALRDIERRETIAVELLGWLRYRDEYRRYWGASAVVAFTEAEGLGYGPFVHFGRAVKAGYLFREREAAAELRRRHGLLVSVDLYRYLVDHRESLESALAMVRQRVQATR